MTVTKNRLQLREAILGKDKFSKIGLFGVCESLHSHVVGTSDPMSDEEFDKWKRFLRCCLDTWYNGDSDFDFAVKQLIRVTLDEAEKYGK